MSHRLDVQVLLLLCLPLGRVNHLRSAADWSGPLVHGARLLDTELSHALLTRTVLATSQCAGTARQGIGIGFGVAGSGPVYHRDNVGLQRFNPARNLALWFSEEIRHCSAE